MTNSFPASRYLPSRYLRDTVDSQTGDEEGLKAGGNAHSLDEYAGPDSFVPRLYLLTRMVMKLGKSGVQ